MFHAIARRQARKAFRDLSAANWERVLDGVADDVHHIFPGQHALGGERHSKEAMRRWFERLFRLYPSIEFEVKRVSAHGWPWDMWIAVEWADPGVAKDGEPYANEGAHWMHIRWGRGVYVHAYLDTQVLVASLARLGAAGESEALAASDQLIFGPPPSPC